MKKIQCNANMQKGGFFSIFGRGLAFFFFMMFMAVPASAQYYDNENLEGEDVRTEHIRTSGVEMVKTLSNDGTRIEEKPYMWFAGFAKVDNKQMAIQIAQREAFATVSRTINNAVADASEKNAAVCNESLNSIVTSSWSQASQTIIRGCEPFGDVIVEYDRNTGLYSVTAKVAIRGDRYAKMLNDVKKKKPAGLSPSDAKAYNKINADVVNILQVNKF